ncbi:hypothetical protein FIBSPDRAFT_891350 [Athelia psychrophila]|uniref:Uncharacterized protein n=1 Tax=Athelia psychrophila TaxID=1759441 RepID=A0A166JT88_9AGAM|nr:hypothetical protein FIBSPDRAFT_891350 [Fibularhizoctonia sp. CBS 109695]
MFQEVCLACGKLLDGDGQTYCSEDCSSSDVASPCISSASSAFSSPQISYATGGDVPALVPSALGSALNSYQAGGTGHRYSTSSSSASSVSWSMLTDEEDDLSVGVADHNYRGGSDYEAHSANLVVPKASALSYARRPSSTNHRSTVPLLHHRNSSSNSSSSNGVPRSAPAHSLSAPEDDPYLSEEHSSHPITTAAAPPSPKKAKRTRNRASLPGYFSLLQMGTSSPQRAPASMASSYASASAVAPPTPFAMARAQALLSASGTSASTATIEAPRGRRREAGESRSTDRSVRSRSRSRSRRVSRPPVQEAHKETHGARGRMDSRSSVEKVFDWSAAALVSAPARGRVARRNSSPLAKMNPLHGRAASPVVSVLSGASAASEARRGRMAAHELDGYIAPAAPGYGVGRSGLMHREVAGRVVGALR